MKVLTIKEPFASLIMNGIKKIETRSWKTNYRGEIYIHAGISKIGNRLKGRDKLLKLIEDMDMNYGNIILKCKLVDCIYMTDEYITDIKKNHYQEYLCGHYEVGRYAWVLDDVEIIEKIPVKGQLGIWNYKM